MTKVHHGHNASVIAPVNEQLSSQLQDISMSQTLVNTSQHQHQPSGGIASNSGVNSSTGFNVNNPQ